MVPSRVMNSIPTRPLGGVRRARWFSRWLLVLVVAFDLLSAPFHHHHHHDGAQGQLAFSTTHASLEDADAHVDSDDHPLASHATMAIRVDPSRLAWLPPIDNADAQIGPVSVVQRLADGDRFLSLPWPPDRSRPDFRSHRSLPPAGRAPPLHA